MVELRHLDMYLALGRPLFPCSERDKSPLTQHGFKDASLDPAAIRAWYARHPGCAWGTPCSPDYTVIDIDPRNGGDRTWAALVAEHGDLPPTPTVDTGSDGLHHVTVAPPGTRKRVVGPGVELLGIGSFVILAPSRIYQPHHSKPYAWRPGRRLWELDPVPTPVCVLATDRGPTPKAVSVSSRSPAGDRVTPVVVAGSPWVVQCDPDLRTHPGAGAAAAGGEGRRPTLLRLVGAHVARGDNPEAIWTWAEAWAARCSPPLEGWQKHVAGVVGKEARQLHIAVALSEHPVAAPVPVTAAPEETRPEETNPPAQVSEFISSHPVSSDLVPSELLTDAGLGEGKSCGGCSPEPRSPDPLTLHPDAYQGVLGGVTQAVGPHTEADEPAVLTCLLTAFGSACGFHPHFDHGKRHGANIFIGLSGATASRKGTATGVGKEVIGKADPEWLDRVQHEGFASGEGLIWAVRDACEKDPVGVTDKRLLVIEEEWAKTFTLGASDKSILTPIIRGCYDRIPIGKKNKGENAYGCKEPHVSIIANITPDDLRQALTGRNAVAIANGFLNRFLLVHTERRKFLPKGGAWRDAVKPFLPRIAAALTVAKTRGRLELDAGAEVVWVAEYERLETRPDGVAGAVTGRASDMVMKLALVYALADGDDAIRLPHLTAGLAVWRYCEATAFRLFGVQATPSAEPDPLWLQTLVLIRSRPGTGRGEVVYALRHAAKAEAVGHALDALHRKGLAHPVVVKPDGGGRPGERWYPGPPDGNGDGDEVVVNNVTPPSPCPAPVSASGSWVVRSEETRPEEMNSAVPVAVPELVSSAVPAGTRCPTLDAELLAELDAMSADDPDPVPALEPTPEPAPAEPPFPAWATGPTPPAGLPAFGVSQAVPPGWLDAGADAEAVARRWPVPEGWKAVGHAVRWADDPAGKLVGRSVFNPAWPVTASPPWDGGEEMFVGMLDGDPALVRVIPPQPV